MYRTHPQFGSKGTHLQVPVYDIYAQFHSHEAILSQFTKKVSTSATEAGNGEVEDDEDDRLDEDELAALTDVDLDREASDEQEIEDLENDIDIDLSEEDIALGKSALTKVKPCHVLYA
jgi:hypothetical protein